MENLDSKRKWVVIVTMLSLIQTYPEHYKYITPKQQSKGFWRHFISFSFHFLFISGVFLTSLRHNAKIKEKPQFEHLRWSFFVVIVNGFWHRDVQLGSKCTSREGRKIVKTLYLARSEVSTLIKYTKTVINNYFKVLTNFTKR